eukprot:g12802.t1
MFVSPTCCSFRSPCHRSARSSDRDACELTPLAPPVDRTLRTLHPLKSSSTECAGVGRNNEPFFRVLVALLETPANGPLADAGGTGPPIIAPPSGPWTLDPDGNCRLCSRLTGSRLDDLELLAETFPIVPAAGAGAAARRKFGNAGLRVSRGVDMRL